MKFTFSGLLFLSTIAIAQAQTDGDLIEKAKKIHEKVITIDTHNDINVANFTENKNYTMDLDTQVNLPKMEKGGMDVTWLIVYTGQDALTPAGYDKAYKNADEKFKAIHRLCEEIAPDKIGLATNSKEVRKLVAEGKKVAMIGVENAYPVGEDLGRIQEFYERGARYMSLAHNGHNQLSDSNTGEADNVWLNDGLSELGKKAIAEMNRCGIMIDVSHPSKEAIKQMFELSKAPLIASHSSARALCNHSRNLDDDLLELFKEKGGVVQTVAFSSYVNTAKHNAFNAAREKVFQKTAEEMNFVIEPWDSVRNMPQEAKDEYYANYYEMRNQAAPAVEDLKKTVGPVDVSDFVDHIDYLVEKIGIDHVGISSDFDGGGGIYGWDDASQSLNVTVELVKREYSEEEIAKLWGENLLRVMDEVQAVAAELNEN